ncbi:MAG: hypothetical protein Q3986_06535 [Akkermansia sp.]|nr:hypothetical protein [Akkermansia sp.]
MQPADISFQVVRVLDSRAQAPTVELYVFTGSFRLARIRMHLAYGKWTQTHRFYAALNPKLLPPPDWCDQALREYRQRAQRASAQTAAPHSVDPSAGRADPPRSSGAR